MDTNTPIKLEFQQDQESENSLGAMVDRLPGHRDRDRRGEQRRQQDQPQGQTIERDMVADRRVIDPGDAP